VIVFFAKVLDYIALNPPLAMKQICRIFMSAAGLEETALAACFGTSANAVHDNLMARATGLEPATFGSTIRCSNQIELRPREGFNRRPASWNQQAPARKRGTAAQPTGAYFVGPGRLVKRKGCDG
jgi:hypothetical protein